jgi:uncharacterized protein (AIM24 family)
MDNNIQMETIFGDGSEQQSGLFGKLLNAGKRVLTGKVFSRHLLTKTTARGKVSFASPYPGQILPLT